MRNAPPIKELLHAPYRRYESSRLEVFITSRAGRQSFTPVSQLAAAPGLKEMPLPQNSNRQMGVWSLLKQTFREWNEDHVPRHAAALAFYTALSLAPLLVISLRVAATFFGNDTVRHEIEQQVEALVGEQGRIAITEILKHANEKGAGIWATIMSTATLLFGASGVFGQLQDSLNTIWKVPQRQQRGILGFLRERFLSILMVMGTAFLLLVSLFVSAALSFLGAYAMHLPEALYRFAELMNVIISLMVFMGLFALMFKFLPETFVAWRDVWPGAAMTAILFSLGKYAIGLYLGQSAIASSYGVAGSLVVLLLWVYYSALIIFWGAEFTQVYARRYR